ncbi:MAG: hypothetical protein CFE28_00395 [Alphaproteobacteria bacterium PA2]|nr:MAG: hypothetical protein CFE28_00395 [Alphaproteobacteria bacterium PA2]
MLLGGLSDDAIDRIRHALPQGFATVVSTFVEAEALLPADIASKAPITWGRDCIGVGLLTALRDRSWIRFDDAAPTTTYIAPISDHLVVCEAGDALSEVIAANYAFSLGAGLQIIKPIPDEICEYLQERLYGILDQREQSQTQVFEEVLDELRARIGPVVLPPSGAVTWISRKLPLGLAHPERPSTHLFTYPDLGLAIANGFAAEQNETPGVNVAIVVDPGTTQAAEIRTTAEALAERRLLVRGLMGRSADVTTVSEDIDHFPYDLIIFSTHCGDASGYRFNYDFDDAEGIARHLVVDIAVGIGQPSDNDDDRFALTELIYFRYLDGVDLNDPRKKESLYVGTAIKDFIDLRGSLESTSKVQIPRVVGSAAMAMSDHNYIVAPQSIAANGTPIIFNNACVSWRELSGRFMFAGARAYVGTIVPVLDAEASEVATRVFRKHYGKPLAHAVWAAQNEVYGDAARRPYVVSGVYPQKLRASAQDTPGIVLRRLQQEGRAWSQRANKELASHLAHAAERSRHVADYYAREVAAWPASLGGDASAQTQSPPDRDVPGVAFESGAAIRRPPSNV